MNFGQAKIIILACTLVFPLFATAHAQNKTSKRPDIVFECRNAASVRAPNCTMSCNDYQPNPPNTPPAPPGAPGITYPRVNINFERIEFYSQTDRQSENWLAIIIGYLTNTGQPVEPVRFIFRTIGTANICQYTGSPLVNGVEPFSVQMISYYGQN